MQALPSEHDVPEAFGVWLTPVVGSHTSVVHGLASSTIGGAPLWQPPLASHVSLPLHAFPSEHDVPAAAAGVLHVPVDVLQVPATWQASAAAQTTAAPPAHVPAWQLSPCVHAFPSEHEVPSALLGWEHVPVLTSHVPGM